MRFHLKHRSSIRCSVGSCCPVSRLFRAVVDLYYFVPVVEVADIPEDTALLWRAQRLGLSWPLHAKLVSPYLEGGWV